MQKMFGCHERYCTPIMYLLHYVINLNNSLGHLLVFTSDRLGSAE